MAMVEFDLLPFSRFPLRKKENIISGFHENWTHDFRTSRCTRLPTRTLGQRGSISSKEYKHAETNVWNSSGSSYYSAGQPAARLV